MKPGDIIETAVWLDGRETPERLAYFERETVNYLNELCQQAHVRHGPLRWSVLRPGADHVPDVPDYIQGPDVRLLVVEANIVAGTPYLPARSFIHDLDPADLLRLRGITRNAHARHFRGRRLTDRECDEIIDSFGPEAAMEAVRLAAVRETIH